MTDESTGLVLARYERAKARFKERDTTLAQIMSIRDGKISEVAPGMFPETGPWQEPIVANMIDVAARDTAEMIAPLPTISCSSSSMVKDADQDRADKRTRIVMAISTASDLQVQMYSGADWYVTSGILAGRVETDPETGNTVIRLVESEGVYYDEDRFGRIVAVYIRQMVSCADLRTLYPEIGPVLDERKQMNGGAEPDLELLTYHDKSVDRLILPEMGLDLLNQPNKFGKVCYRIARRPGGRRPRGQYDDVMFVQLAKARFALLAMESAVEAVGAPMIVPDDVHNVPMGRGAVIHTANPEKVGKLDIHTPREVYTQQGALDSELRMGARYPEVRTGNPDASVITGKGVQALMGTMDTQIRTATAILARWLSDLFSLALEYEEWHYGAKKRKLTGSSSGVPFVVEYTPSRDIKGDYTVDVQYGLMAGLDPSRWLIFGLQARSEKLISRDYLRRQMPADFDAGDEEQKIDIEDMRDAAKQAFAGYAQAIPVLAQQGQDPTEILAAIATVIAQRQKGVVIEDAIAQALAPPEPEAPQTLEEQAAGLPGGGGGVPEGLSATGLLKGVAPGQAGMAPGGRPDLRMALASMDSNGTPRLSVSTSRREAF